MFPSHSSLRRKNSIGVRLDNPTVMSVTLEEFMFLCWCTKSRYDLQLMWTIAQPETPLEAADTHLRIRAESIWKKTKPKPSNNLKAWTTENIIQGHFCSPSVLISIVANTLIISYEWQHKQTIQIFIRCCLLRNWLQLVFLCAHVSIQ